MKFIKFILFITAVLLIHHAYAQSSGKGDIIISQEKIYDVPMPSWMQENSKESLNYINNTATVIPINSLHEYHNSQQ